MEIDGCVYKVHPVYDLYAADDNGNVINIVKKVPIEGCKVNSGYISISVRKHGDKGQKNVRVHRFVWECFNGLIPDGKVIDHINNIKDDNKLSNLQLMTQQENCKKSAKDRDYTFVAKNHQNRKYIKAINQSTNEITYYNSLYAVHQHIGINPGIIKMVCEGLNNCKSGISKIDQCAYKFEYINNDNMPNKFLKSANIRPHKLTEEDKKKHQIEAIRKWQNKEFVCLKCSKTYKNSSKYFHNKKCSKK